MAVTKKPTKTKQTDHTHGLTSGETQQMTPAELEKAVGIEPWTRPRRSGPSGGQAGEHDALGAPL